MDSLLPASSHGRLDYPAFPYIPSPNHTRMPAKLARIMDVRTQSGMRDSHGLITVKDPDNINLFQGRRVIVILLGGNEPRWP